MPAIDIGTHLGPYVIVDALGSGGMGRVFRARDSRLERDVAIKVLADRPHRYHSDRERFEREIKAVAALSHPNILAIFDMGELGDHRYAVMEFLHGETLRTSLMRGKLPWKKAVDIGAAIADGLAAAHAQGIIHCDLKPENIFVLKDGRFKILDFGIARRNLHHGPDHELEGTLIYMSPEQVSGDSLTPQSDLFSLAVLLYEALSGIRPFERTTALKSVYAILHEAHQPVSNLVEGLPIEFEKIIDHALQKDPGDRFHSASDFAEALRNIEPGLHKPWHDRDHPCIAYRKPQFDIDLSFLEMPEVQYAQSGDVNIAYQVTGSGPVDLVFVMGWVSHLEYFWREPSFARFLYRLASFARLIVFDKRGTGLSDRVSINRLPTMEQRMDDVRAVMEAVGSQRAFLCGVSEGGPLCALFAATYPEKTAGTIMIGSYAKRIWAPDYPWAPTANQREKFFEYMKKNWGGPVGIEDRAPSMAHDPAFRKWWATYLRMGASPNAAVALTQMNAEIDIRHVLPHIAVPTLVIHRSGDACLKIEEGRYLAERIPTARFVELSGIDHLPFVGNQDEILRETETFVAQVQEVAVASRKTLAWLQIISNSSDLEQMAQDFGGCLQGELPAITFSGPGRAIQCALAIQHHDPDSRAAIHYDVLNLTTCSGPARDRAHAIIESVPKGQVWASRAVIDLIAGFGFRLTEIEALDQGLYRVTREGGPRPAA